MVKELKRGYNFVKWKGGLLSKKRDRVRFNTLRSQFCFTGDISLGDLKSIADIEWGPWLGN